MFLLRYLYILALGVWLGGMGVAGFITAPSVFQVLEAWNPVEGRVLAGQVVGHMLSKLRDPVRGSAHLRTHPCGASVSLHAVAVSAGGPRLFIHDNGLLATFLCAKWGALVWLAFPRTSGA